MSPFFNDVGYGPYQGTVDVGASVGVAPDVCHPVAVTPFLSVQEIGCFDESRTLYSRTYPLAAATSYAIPFSRKLIMMFPIL